jgi:hypothetical protein
VEEDVLNGVIMRFRPSIETRRLDAVEISDPVWETIYWGVTRASRWAHDEPTASGEAPPSPDDLKAMIEEIRKCRDQLGKDKIAKRRQEKIKPSLV